MNPLRFVFTLGLLSFVASIHAATTSNLRTDDLGQGLTYLRPATDGKMDGVIPLKTISTGSVVIDLRYFSSDENADAWLAAIQTFTAPRRLCMVLISPETSPALLAGLSSELPGCITVGRTSPALGANILVETSAATDRKVWDAIGQGTSLAKLITENADKPRYDEAVLAKEYAANEDPAPADDDTGTPAPATKTKEPKKPTAPAPLIDTVLKRAVQIHRGLLALRRL